MKKNKLCKNCIYVCFYKPKYFCGLQQSQTTAHSTCNKCDIEELKSDKIFGYFNQIED